jgi:FkbM family methyltransferase
MSLAKTLKVLARSRSRSFTRDFNAYQGGQGSSGTASVTWWNGDGRAVHYRRGTSDAGLVYDILFKPGRKSEYWLPEDIEPKVVLDVGGNIGIAARYLSFRFPSAQVHSFEPVPANYELARRNLAQTRACVHPFGLAGKSAMVDLGLPTGADANRGGFSLYCVGDGARTIRGEVRAADQALAELGLASADVIKLDVEGAEHDIIAALPDSVLAGATWIYGELHSELVDPRNAFRVLERLAAWFDIGMHKPLRKRNWFFDACNRRYSARFRDFRRGR